MTVATSTDHRAPGTGHNSARIKRLAEAHVLAAAIWRHYLSSGVIPSGVEGSALPAFQKALILDTARGLGFSAPGGPASGGPVQSRKELTAEQLGRISTALRARMQELGIPEPEQSRPPERATADQYRRLYKVIDKVERLPGWGGRQHTLNFIHRQTGRRAWPVRGLTRSQAEAIERGLDGVLRHHRDGQA